MIKKLTLLITVGLLVTGACSGAGELLGGKQAEDAPTITQPGDPLSYRWGEVRVLSFHRPTAFQVLKADLFAGVTESRPARPAKGAEFVSVELEFTCARDETKCDQPPQALLSLELVDGRIVEEGFVPMTIPWMGAEEVVGGGQVTGWITFEIPADSEVAALLLAPYEVEGVLRVALPDPVDGYAIEMPWHEAGDGSAEQELTTLRRDMENKGFEMIWAGYYRSEGETGLHVTVYTEELFFFEDSDAITEAQDTLLAAVELWPAYRGEATYLGVEMWNELSGETIALVGVDAEDIEAYRNGETDLSTFMSQQWVVDYDS